jgi:FkbM family methyltransferase
MDHVSADNTSRMTFLSSSLGSARNLVDQIRLFRNWPHAIRNRLDLNGGAEAVYRFRSGMELVLGAGPQDLTIVNELIRLGIYRPTEDFQIRDGWNVLDLGAHKGVFTVLAATVGPQTRVVSVEPEPYNHAFLLQNLERNRLRNVSVIAAAVWTEDGHMSLERGDDWEHQLAVLNDHDSVDEVVVHTVPLHRLLEEFDGRIDLLKIDIEGAEHAVLLEASDETLSRIDRIVLEYHPVRDLSEASAGFEIEQRLQSAGFECFHTDDVHPTLFAVRRRGDG